jgi:hypothetical protein
LHCSSLYMGPPRKRAWPLTLYHPTVAILGSES